MALLIVFSHACVRVFWSCDRELEERLNRNSTGVDSVAAEIKDSGKSSGNMQWLLVGVWIVFYFFLNNNAS